MSRLKNPLLAGLAGVLLVTLVTAVYRLGWQVPLLSRTVDVLELKTLDWRFELRGEQQPGDETVILGFDDETIRADPSLFERRDGWVRVLEALRESGARVIGVDALFVDPEHLLDPHLKEDIDEYLRARGPAGEQGTRAEQLLGRVLHETRADRRLVAAVREAGNVVLAYHLGTSGGMTGDDPALAKSSYGQAVPGPLLPPEGDQVLASMPDLNAAARSLGVISVGEDATRSVRQLVAVRRFKGAFVTPLAIQLVAAFRGLDKARLVYLGDGTGGKPEIRLGDQVVPLTLEHGLWLNYRGGPKTFETYPVIDLVRGKLPAGALRDRIVLLGFTYFGHDTVGTPFSRYSPGVEVHATAVDNLLRGDFLNRASWWVDTLVCLGFGLLLVLLYWPRLGLSPLFQVGGSLLLLIGYLGLGILVFVRSQVWLAWIGPIAMFMLVSLICLLLSYLSEGLQRRRLRHAFAHYLADDVIEQMLKRPGALELGGERRELTVLFSDIRGFTTISEGLAPEALAELLNEYLTPMTGIVFANRGLLDKYMGDAIMAIYGAPVPFVDHPHAACESALQMIEEIGRLQQGWQERGLPRLDIGVGINTGPMSVGNMGSADRFDYTVLGDHVNLGSRLEGLNKQFGTRVIISEFTRRAIGDRFTCRELDRVAVWGKQEPVRIFELIHRDARVPDRDAWIASFERALGAYRSQRWEDARFMFAELVDRRDDAPARAYVERCRQMKATPPGPDWDGVFRMTSK